MKINKIILTICHFFGFRRTEAHIDDIKIYIPSDYGDCVYNFDFTIKIVDDIKEQTYRELSIESNKKLIDDIKEQTYIELEHNKKLKKWCTITRQIWIVLPRSQMKRFNYIDGTLYCIGLDDVAAQRADKLSKILNEK